MNYIGLDGDHKSLLRAAETPGNLYFTPLSFAVGSSVVSQQITTARGVQIQSDAPYQVAFGSEKGEDPTAAAFTAMTFSYPPDVEPRLFPCTPGCRFRIIGV